MLPPSLDEDSAIRSTDTDAALARLSTVRKGYLEDPYIKYLVPRAQFQATRPPLINIGTHARVTSIDELVTQWISLSHAETGLGCQIVSLGAGSDTRFWRITTSKLGDALERYIEVDFPEVTTKKAIAIKKSKEMTAALGDPSSIQLVKGGTQLHSRRYHLVPADLRLSPDEAFQSLTSPPPPPDANTSSILASSLPTLLLFECVLAYMSPEASHALLAWFVDYFDSSQKPGSTALGALVYEMFGLQDSFGQVMLNNMKARNITLPGALPYPTLTSLPDRFLQHGFTSSQALTLRDIRRRYTKPEEVARTSKIEMLDELEELELVLAHYAISWAVKIPEVYPNEFGSTQWSSWGLKLCPQSEESKET